MKANRGLGAYLDDPDIVAIDRLNISCCRNPLNAAPEPSERVPAPSNRGHCRDSRNALVTMMALGREKEKASRIASQRKLFYFQGAKYAPVAQKSVVLCSIHKVSSTRTIVNKCRTLWHRRQPLNADALSGCLLNWFAGRTPVDSQAGNRKANTDSMSH
jgi:hypothetical protein